MPGTRLRLQGRGLFKKCGLYPHFSYLLVAKRRKRRPDKACEPSPTKAYSCSPSRRTRERNAVRADDGADAVEWV